MLVRNVRVLLQFLLIAGLITVSVSLPGTSGQTSSQVATPVKVTELEVRDRVYLVRDKPGTPTQFQMIVNAGCVDEADGQCRGLAHYLEHLLLVGRNPEHKDSAVTFIPDAYANGWTNMRATAYVHGIPARPAGPKAELDFLFRFYAARLQDFNIPEAEAERERRVVRQEHDMRIGGNPFLTFARALDRKLMPDHPFGQWTIGTAEEIDKFTLAAARDLHRSWYAINNVYFIIRGDIDPADLKDLADKALAGLSPRELPKRATLQRPAALVERHDLVNQHPQIKRAGVYYKKLIHLDEQDRDTNRAARLLLGNFLTSKLPGSPHAVLVDERKLAADRPFSFIERVAPGAFRLTMGADVAPGVKPEDLREAMATYVEGLAKSGRASAELDRLKQRFAADRATGDTDPIRAYNRFVTWIAGNLPPSGHVGWPARVAAVTIADVTALTAGFSGPGKIVTGIMRPAASAGSTPQ